jgi:predicted membrane GTPase involved in stress response
MNGSTRAVANDQHDAGRQGRAVDYIMPARGLIGFRTGTSTQAPG